MKYLKYFSFLLLAFLWSCSGSTESVSSSNDTETAEVGGKPAVFPINFYKKLRGTIGNGIPVTMDLVKDDTMLVGGYYALDALFFVVNGFATGQGLSDNLMLNGPHIGITVLVAYALMKSVRRIELNEETS